MDPLVETGTGCTGVGINDARPNFRLREGPGRGSQHKVAAKQMLRCNVALKCLPQSSDDGVVARTYSPWRAVKVVLELDTCMDGKAHQ